MDTKGHQGGLCPHPAGGLAIDVLVHLTSAYRRHHSTETALLKVLSDALIAADEKKVTLPVSYTHLTLPTIYSV